MATIASLYGGHRHVPRRCESAPIVPQSSSRRGKAESSSRQQFHTHLQQQWIKWKNHHQARSTGFTKLGLRRMVCLIFPGLVAFSCLTLLVSSRTTGLVDLEANNPHRHPFVRSPHIRHRNAREQQQLLKQQQQQRQASHSSTSSSWWSSSSNPAVNSPRSLLFSSLGGSSNHNHEQPQQENKQQASQQESKTTTTLQEAAEEPRFLVFGTSSTYGTGLEDPWREAYPYQLSLYTHNAATRHGGFTLAAACTQSIVRDDIYDVIVVEFTTWGTALTILSQRLRQRFPHATLIFLRLWHPSQLKYTPLPDKKSRPNKNATTTTMDFHAFRKMGGKTRAMDDPELYFEIYSQKKQWHFEKPNDEATVLDMASQLSASYFAMNLPDDDLFDYPKTMMDQLSIFEPSGSGDDLNKAGHATVAASLRSILRSTPLPSPQSAQQVRPWPELELQDVCRLWYENGLYQQPASAQESGEGLRKVEFSKAGVAADHYWTLGSSRGASGHAQNKEPNHKHALEVDDVTGSTLTLQNPFAEPRMLYLTYLTTYAPLEEEEEEDWESTSRDDPPEFSKLRVRINNKPAVLIEALHHQTKVKDEELLQQQQQEEQAQGGSTTANNKKNKEAKRPELARTTAVGMIPPGQSVIRLDPVPTPLYKRVAASSSSSNSATASGTRPFRLLGWSLLPQQVVDALQLQTIEYSLEESAVLPSSTDWEWLS